MACFRGNCQLIFQIKKYLSYKNSLNSLQYIGARASVKFHFLCCHVGCFLKNLNGKSNEPAELFHQDISEMKVGIRFFRGGGVALGELLADGQINVIMLLPLVLRYHKQI